MPVVEIADPSGESRAWISPEAGFNCFRFLARSGEDALEVLSAEDDFEDGSKPPSHSGIPILFPFPNRIRSGRYSWDGKEYELPESLVSYDGSGNAIHGFCLDRPWRIAQQTPSSVTGVFRLSEDAPDRLELWPADAEIEVLYKVQGTTLHSRITIRNPDDKPLPWGVGTHAYFRLPLSSDSQAQQTTVYAPVQATRELIEYLPSGRTEELTPDVNLAGSPEYGELRLDNAFAGLTADDDGMVTTRVSDPHSGRSVEQRFSADFQELVAFTPPWTDAICLEPYTCTTDAINLQQHDIKAGLKVLAPGESWSGVIDIKALFSA